MNKRLFVLSLLPQACGLSAFTCLLLTETWVQINSYLQFLKQQLRFAPSEKAIGSSGDCSNIALWLQPRASRQEWSPEWPDLLISPEKPESKIFHPNLLICKNMLAINSHFKKMCKQCAEGIRHVCRPPLALRFVARSLAWKENKRGVARQDNDRRV